MAKKKQLPKTLRITYVRSAIGHKKGQKATLRALGLHRLGQSVEHRATPTIRGMVAKVAHLVQIEEMESGEGVQ